MLEELSRKSWWKSPVVGFLKFGKFIDDKKREFYDVSGFFYDICGSLEWGILRIPTKHLQSFPYMRQ